MMRLLICYKRGRIHTLRAKIVVSIVLMTLLFLANYMPEIINALRIYGLHQWEASIYSIPSLEGFPVSLSLGEYFGLMFTLRYLMAFFGLTLIFAASILCKNMPVTILSMLLFLVAPLLVELLGLENIRNFSFNRFFTVNGYLDLMQKHRLFGFSLLIPGSVAGFGVWVIKGSSYCQRKLYQK